MECRQAMSTKTYRYKVQKMMKLVNEMTEAGYPTAFVYTTKVGSVVSHGEKTLTNCIDENIKKWSSKGKFKAQSETKEVKQKIAVPKFLKHFDDMNQMELRFAVAELVKLGQDNIGLGRVDYKQPPPAWWPEEIPFIDIQRTRTTGELRTIARMAYEYYDEILDDNSECSHTSDCCSNFSNIRYVHEEVPTSCTGEDVKEWLPEDTPREQPVVKEVTQKIAVLEFPKHIEDMNQVELRLAVAELVKLGQDNSGLGRVNYKQPPPEWWPVEIPFADIQRSRTTGELRRIARMANDYYSEMLGENSEGSCAIGTCNILSNIQDGDDKEVPAEKIFSDAYSKQRASNLRPSIIYVKPSNHTTLSYAAEDTFQQQSAQVDSKKQNSHTSGMPQNVLIKPLRKRARTSPCKRRTQVNSQQKRTQPAGLQQNVQVKPWKKRSRDTPRQRSVQVNRQKQGNQAKPRQQSPQVQTRRKSFLAAPWQQGTQSSPRKQAAQAIFFNPPLNPHWRRIQAASRQQRAQVNSKQCPG